MNNTIIWNNKIKISNLLVIQFMLISIKLIFLVNWKIFIKI